MPLLVCIILLCGGGSGIISSGTGRRQTMAAAAASTSATLDTLSAASVAASEAIETMMVPVLSAKALVTRTALENSASSVDACESNMHKALEKGNKLCSKVWKIYTRCYKRATIDYKAAVAEANVNASIHQLRLHLVRKAQCLLKRASVSTNLINMPILSKTEGKTPSSLSSLAAAASAACDDTAEMVNSTNADKLSREGSLNDYYNNYYKDLPKPAALLANICKAKCLSMKQEIDFCLQEMNYLRMQRNAACCAAEATLTTPLRARLLEPVHCDYTTVTGDECFARWLASHGLEEKWRAHEAEGNDKAATCTDLSNQHSTAASRCRTLLDAVPSDCKIPIDIPDVVPFKASSGASSSSSSSSSFSCSTVNNDTTTYFDNGNATPKTTSTLTPESSSCVKYEAPTCPTGCDGNVGGPGSHVRRRRRRRRDVDGSTKAGTDIESLCGAGTFFSKKLQKCQPNTNNLPSCYPDLLSRFGVFGSASLFVRDKKGRCTPICTGANVDGKKTADIFDIITTAAANAATSTASTTSTTTTTTTSTSTTATANRPSSPPSFSPAAVALCSALDQCSRTHMASCCANRPAPGPISLPEMVKAGGYTCSLRAPTVAGCLEDLSMRLVSTRAAYRAAEARAQVDAAQCAADALEDCEAERGACAADFECAVICRTSLMPQPVEKSACPSQGPDHQCVQPGQCPSWCNNNKVQEDGIAKPRRRRDDDYANAAGVVDENVCDLGTRWTGNDCVFDVRGVNVCDMELMQGFLSGHSVSTAAWTYIGADSTCGQQVDIAPTIARCLRCPPINRKVSQAAHSHVTNNGILPSTATFVCPKNTVLVGPKVMYCVVESDYVHWMSETQGTTMPHCDSISKSERKRLQKARRKERKAEIGVNLPF